MKITSREFAIQKHGSQMYGDKPYVYHLDQVVEEIYKLHTDKSIRDYKILEDIAYLHDTLEDTETCFREIEGLFGSVVANSVLTLTKQKGLKYDYYIRTLKRTFYALIVKIADTRCNLKQSIIDDDENRIVKYAKQLMLLEE